ncbi:hypothetical protein [Xanthomonas rydalmerensis]|uniref:Uncharacterized protein n=1 Tax=Xanthomonas rydalmerensis TaxID=3046274 RepID=A0ABZ0JM40_9XANT|nr:hypothetical protein [Xanthomonas sp. DM-2023]WOS40700.1 hypothetical protein QN243_20280 [Xanthomonas sp. DM-2023]WOS44884.1 hypothetical protein QN242_20280 [Xanthomonas sp. DM-2023]WOS49064.1 hypothetical protein QN240_20280 [Xanthomonas sp. DM-2023]WOS53244.1 hypothetical protein QN244_20285 [Xanthomonas sp. DM-2023]WOS57427.1 hypothetical protein QN245_20280 [Xanthomonas sp. DM-2023]
MSGTSTITIDHASALIERYRESDWITQEIAERAQRAIRERLYYGNPMTTAHRARMLALRFGIVDAPFEALGN